MLISLKYCRVFALWLLWLLCALIGGLVHYITYTQTKPHLGIWTGTAVALYGDKPVEVEMQLIVDDAKTESARLITSYSDVDEENDALKSNITVDAMVIERNNEELTLSLKNPNYSNKEKLEAFLGRALPEQGTLISGRAWPISEDEMFLYLTLGFGEKLRIVIRRER